MVQRQIWDETCHIAVASGTTMEARCIEFRIDGHIALQSTYILTVAAQSGVTERRAIQIMTLIIFRLISIFFHLFQF